MSEKMKIAVAGTGYVGLSLAVLLSQHNEVRALDIVSEKVEKINAFQSPIQDDEIELFLAEAKAGTRKLDLHATVDAPTIQARISPSWPRQRTTTRTATFSTPRLLKPQFRQSAR